MPQSAPAPLLTRLLGDSGPLIVCLPGLGGTTKYWEQPLGPLATTHRLLLVDLLGFGESPKPWHRYTVERHIEALRATLSAYQSFTLVGHSMGAALALIYAARYPERVSRLVLVSLPYFGSQREAYAHFRNGGTKYGWLVTNMWLVAVTCLVSRRVFGRLLPRLRPDLPQEIVRESLKHTWLSSTSSLWQVLYRHDLNEDADQLPATLPVLCLHGDQDDLAPVEAMERLAAQRPNWRVHVLPGLDHHPLLRTPEACLALLSPVFGEADPS